MFSGPARVSRTRGGNPARNYNHGSNAARNRFTHRAARRLPTKITLRFLTSADGNSGNRVRNAFASDTVVYGRYIPFVRKP